MNHPLHQKQEDKTLLGAALLCGLLHHLLFYERPWGISVPMFAALFYAMFYWAYQGDTERKLGLSSFLLLPIALLSLSYGVFTHQLFRVLNILVIPGLVLIHTVWTVRARMLEPTKLVLLLLEQVFIQTVRYVPQPLKLLYRSFTSRLSSHRSRELLKVLIGLLLSIPLLALVISLLASADFMFDRSMSKLPDLLDRFELGELLFRGLWVLAIGCVLFAYFKGLLEPRPVHVPRPKPDDMLSASGAAVWKTPADGPQAAPFVLPKLDATIAATLLMVLNAVYVLFAVVQFSYFFGGGAAELPDGTTYAEYARRGFGELVVVTLINFTVLLAVLYGTNRSAPKADRLLRGLLAILICCTGVMLSSAYLRLSMYEEAYGFTTTRVLVHAFMIFLLALFAVALYKLWNDSVSLCAPYLAIFLLFYVGLNYMNIDGTIAKSNMARYEASGTIDVMYLGSLSYEVVPYLLELKRKHPELKETEESLRMMTERLRMEPERSWISFNWSEWRARKALLGKAGE